MSWVCVRGGRLIDVAQARDDITDMWIENGRVAPAGHRPAADVPIDLVDAAGRAVVPALYDLDAGRHDSSITASAAASALSGGLARLAVDGHPRGVPPGWLSWAPEGSVGSVPEQWHVIPSSTNDLDRALDEAAESGRTLWVRTGAAPAEQGGVMAEGAYALRLGLPGVSRAALARTAWMVIDGVRRTGARVHLRAVATTEVVDAVRAAKREGLGVTCDVQAHHLHLVDVDIGYYDTRFRVSPPLFSPSDRAALSMAMQDGTIDAVTSGHVDVTRADKDDFFCRAQAGAPGLGLTFSLAWSWAQRERLDIRYALRAMTVGPARVLDQAPNPPIAGLSAGMPADFCLVDLDAWWMLDETSDLPEAGCSPFSGTFLPGRIVSTYVSGRKVS